MTYTEICTQLNDEIEYEYSTRIQDLQKFENCIELSVVTDEEKDNTRKVLIVMAYAYFEGFCKHALLIYADYINRQSLTVKQVKPCLAASATKHDFDLLHNPEHKPTEIRGIKIAADARLYRLSRRTEFMEKYQTIMNSTVVIDDKVVDTESNLKSEVLKSLLYKLDLDYTIVDNYQNTLNKVLGIRNAIAHGEIRRPIEKTKYEDYKNDIIALMDIVKETINSSFRDKTYLSISA